MLKPKPKKIEDAPVSGHIKKPETAGTPPLKLFRQALEEATEHRGILVEQAWTTEVENQKFIVMVQWVQSKKYPVWTFYEENGEDSKMHWSQMFTPTDLVLLYDVICMTAPATGSAAAIPESLKPRKLPEEAGRESPASPAGDSSIAPSARAAGGSVPPAGSVPAGDNAPRHAPARAPLAGNAPPNAAVRAPLAGNAPPNAAARTPLAGNAPPSAAAKAPPTPPQAPTPVYPGYGPELFSSQPTFMPLPSVPYHPPANAPTAPSAPSGAHASAIPASSSPLARPVSFDYELLSQRANILLGELLCEAGLINNTMLESALKVQEFVREERMSPAKACEVLKKFHETGTAIFDYLDLEDFDMSPGAEGKSAQVQVQVHAGAHSAPAAGAAPPVDEKIRTMHAAFDLLQKAGLVTEDDVKQAAVVRKKHGGTMPEILQAAHKCDKNTYDAAEICVQLVHDGLMKVEQCIIALNYCSRSRVTFEAALDELGWEKPKLVKKAE